MKVLLISANRLTVPYPVYPLGLDYVAGTISDKHIVEIIDMNDIKKTDILINKVKSFNPDIIGISLRNIDNTDTKNSAEFISPYKEITDAIRGCSSSPIVLGGSGFTIFPQEIMHALDADFGVIGEGERFSYLLDALEKQQDIEIIPGIISKKNYSDTNLTNLIPPPWEHTIKRAINPQSDYINYYLKKGGMLNIQTKRGCNFNCVYCTYPHIEGNTLRYIPPKEVAQNALAIQDAGAKYFFITDSAFNSDYDHSIAVAEEFIKAGITIPWGAFFAPTKPPQNYFTIMKEAGLSHVEFGTESLSPPVLKKYRKPFTPDQVLQCHEKANEAGLYVSHYLLLGGPGETSETVDETLQNAQKLTKTVLFFFCGMRIYPHTELYDIAVAEGQIKHTDNILYPVFYQSPAITSEAIIQKVSLLEKNRPNWIVGSGGDETSAIISKMYRRGHSGPLWELLIQ